MIIEAAIAVLLIGISANDRISAGDAAAEGAATLSAEGWQAFEKGDYRNAASRFAAAAEADSTVDRYPYMRGLSFLYLNETEEAAQAFQAALSLSPRHGKAHTNLARAYLSSGRITEASLHAAYGIRDASDSGAWNVMGLAQLASDDLAGARNSFRMAVELDSRNAWANNNLGYTMIQLGDSAGAIACLQNASSLTPDSPTMLNNLGIAYERSGRLTEAISTFRKVLEMAPGHVKASQSLHRLTNGQFN